MFLPIGKNTADATVMHSWLLMKQFFFRSAALMLLFALPEIGLHIPIIGLLMFIPALFIINIPGVIFAPLVGPSIIDIHEFGAVPKGALGWSLVIGFWVVAAMTISAVSLLIKPAVNKNPKIRS